MAARVLYRYGLRGAGADGSRQQSALSADLLRHRLLFVQLRPPAAAAGHLQHPADPHLPRGRYIVQPGAFPDGMDNRRSRVGYELEVCMGMGIPIPMGFPWDAHGSSFGLLMGMGMGIVLMGMGIA